jgi:hypothetical protein
MAGDEEIDGLKEKWICHHCVAETYLCDEMKRKGARAQCSYCERTRRCYRIEDMADRIETAFEQHYTRTADQPNSWQQSLLSDRESDYIWLRDGEPVLDAIESAAEIPREAAEDIQAVLDDRHGDFDSAAMGEETEFGSDTCYEEKGPNDAIWQAEWRDFERALKTEARFFSRAATSHLAEIFGGIDQMTTHDGRPLVIDAGPDTQLEAIYRARVFQSDDKLKEALCRPDTHVGSPPARLASAGRMNALGISVFYGANDPGVAVAEVRPPVGSQVAVARFAIIRPLRLLDLTALNTVMAGGSIFDRGLAARLERATFLRSLSDRIVRPVMPDDEAFDYLPTQAIADFLATENEPVLDGIVYPSLQAAGNALNIVLFHKAARVEDLPLPEGTEITADTGYGTEDGWEVDYSVVEAAPLPEQQDGKKGNVVRAFDMDAFAASAWGRSDSDLRDTTLRVDLTAVRVHVVHRVQFECDEHEVRRHRTERRDALF